MRGSVPIAGAVIEFDDAAGLGIVGAADGRDYPFHCVEIADGSRTIEVGTAVWFTVLAKLGALEAGCLTTR